MTDSDQNDNTPEETPSGQFPRRRRRIDSGAPEESTPALHPVPESPAPAKAPVTGDELEAAVKGAAEPKLESSMSGRAKVVKVEEEDEELTPARRVVRFFLMLAVVAAGFGCLWMVLDSMQEAQHQASQEQLASLPPAAAIDIPKDADDLAKKWNLAISKGEYGTVLKDSSALREKYHNHLGVMQAIYKAEAISAVTLVAGVLDELPNATLADLAVPIDANIQALERRLVYLRTLRGHREDWGDSLTDIPGVDVIYQRYAKEIDDAEKQLSDWKTGLRLMVRARDITEDETPDWKQAAQLLRSAWTFLGLPPLLQSAKNAEEVANAEYMLSRQVIEKAVTHLKLVNWAAAPMPPASGTDATRLQQVNKAVRGRYDALMNTVGAWDALDRAVKTGATLYSQGKVEEALTTIDDALKLANPDNPLTTNLYRRLQSMRKHYIAVQAAWSKALAVKESGSLQDQLAAWSAFQSTLTKSDVHYSGLFFGELRLVKAEIQTRIAAQYQRLDEIESGYTRITLQMRKPESPRAPFAAQARILGAMASVADQIRATADLVPDWDLGASTEQQIAHAKSILADHNDQARRLHNLYTLYQKRGQREVARECLVRVILLGQASSNPWWKEADRILKAKKTP